MTDHQPVIAALLQLESDIDVAGWDQLPKLMNLYREPDAVSCREVLVPQHVWRMTKRPQAVLRSLASIITTADIPEWAQPDRSFVGCAFTFEAWAVGGNLKDAAQIAEVSAAADRRELHKHPRRIEQRMVHAHVEDIGLITVSRDRGGEPVVIGAVVDNGVMSGDVPDALRELAEASLAVRST
jgi:hypothetical protein